MKLIKFFFFFSILKISEGCYETIISLSFTTITVSIDLSLTILCTRRAASCLLNKFHKMHENKCMEHHEKFNDKLYNNENTLMKINFSGIDAVAAQLLQIEMLHRKLIPGD